jgi:hypothetical protein
MKNKAKKNREFSTAEKISRKKAIKKAGFYSLTAASMILLLGSPKSAAASVPSSPPVW